MIIQNEEVLDKNEQFIEEKSSMYFILNGKYKVQTVLFSLVNR